MLERLSIKNYALIDSLDLDFTEGLTILTGETGAGKSIMLGALSLLLGGRADTRVISDGGSKSIVEAIFSGADEDVKRYFEQNDLEWNEGEIIIRREIAQNGKSRAFINDRPVTLNILEGVSEQLIDIHSQHANARLNDPRTQLGIIDVIACNDTLKKEYNEEFTAYVNLRGRIHRLREEIEKNKENAEFIRFQLEQLNRLQPKKGELPEIERRYEILSDADEIKERLGTIGNILGGYQDSVLEKLEDVKSISEDIDMNKFTQESDESDITERLHSLIVELKDIHSTLEGYAADIDSDPRTLAKVTGRMNAYYEAIKRFRVSEADELVDIREELLSKMQALESGDTNLPELEKEYRQRGRALKEKAERLSISRRNGAEEFSEMLNKTARPLGLKNMEFSVSIKSGKLTASGQDNVEFMCSFNKNQIPGPITKIASGGEISRLMLSLKCILAGRMNLPTIIFDEIDTGVSGEIADRMGDMMLAMSNDMQVMAITHLPQVAAKGKSHFKVYKQDNEDKTATYVRKLTDDERIRELASMMSGSSVSEAAIENARTLLEKS